MGPSSLRAVIVAWQNGSHRNRVVVVGINRFVRGEALYKNVFCKIQTSNLIYRRLRKTIKRNSRQIGHRDIKFSDF